jgi:haloalkane dehalogenase
MEILKDREVSIMKTSKATSEYNFESHFMDIDGVKIHYIDEGSGDPVVFLHGMPTWSYLWRNVIPTVASKCRCIAPDFVGMGLSDKPDIEYSLFDHIHYLTKFLDKLNLDKLTLVMHGWGSVVGFHYAMQHEQRMKGLAFNEAHIRPVTKWDALSLPIQQFLSLIRDDEHAYQEIVRNNYLIETLLPTGVLRPLTEEELNHYRQPFLTIESRKALWQYIHEFPKGNGQPIDIVALMREYSERLQESEIPKLMFYAVPGFMTSIDDVRWAKEHFSNLEIVDLGEALHFGPEGNPLVLANEFLEWFERIPLTA